MTALMPIFIVLDPFELDNEEYDEFEADGKLFFYYSEWEAHEKHPGCPVIRQDIISMNDLDVN